MKVGFVVESIVPDRTEYKKYMPSYVPDERVILEIEVDDKEVTRDADCIIITEQGMADVLEKLVAISSKAEKQYGLNISNRK